MEKSEITHDQTRRPAEVPQEELKTALIVLSKWLTKVLKGRTRIGPLSEANLGEKPVVFISKLAYIKWASGSWKWKDSLSLQTQLIRIANSEIHHIIRDWKKQNEPEFLSASQDENVQRELDLMVAEAEMDEELKAVAYEQAEMLLKDDPELLKFLHLVRELNDRRAISKRMKITIVEVRALETKMIDKVRQNKYKINSL
jgi:hypothetical protein